MISRGKTRAGAPAPAVKVKTDEGTPLSLRDLRGRKIAVFLTARFPEEYLVAILPLLSERAFAFHEMDCSPLLLTGIDVFALGRMREAHDPPFVMLSDPSLLLHAALGSAGGEEVAAWLIGEDGVLSTPLQGPRDPSAVVEGALDLLAALGKPQK